jgi:hypothetical protein
MICQIIGITRCIQQKLLLSIGLSCLSTSIFKEQNQERG